MAGRHIEHDFPIVELNPLSIPEWAWFKPLYKMRSWRMP